MSCCNDSNSNVCRQDIPYPQISHESVPSLISNLILALYGEITKVVVDGRVTWDIPCDPNANPASIVDFPREEGEGLLCYILRYFNYVSPIIDDVVTISGTQTILGQKTFNWIKLPVGTTGTRPTGQTGLIRFNTDLNQFEGYNNTTWSSIGNQTNGLIYSDTMPAGYSGLEWVDTTTMKRYQWYSDSWIETFGGNNGVTTGGGTGATNITVSSIQPNPANEGDMWTNLDTYIQFQYISGIWVQV